MGWGGAGSTLARVLHVGIGMTIADILALLIGTIVGVAIGTPIGRKIGAYVADRWG